LYPTHVDELESSENNRGRGRTTGPRE